MSIIVNIRGTGGSGKSTVPLQMYASDESKYLIVPEDKSYALTVFPKYRFIAIGKYHNKTGGMDGLKTTEMVERSLEEAKKLSRELGYDILMEGLLASGLQSRYLAMFQKASSDGFKPIVLVYTTPPDVCVKRIMERNGGKPIKEKHVISKYNATMRAYDYFVENNITAKKVDTTKTPKELMLEKFLGAVERWKKEC